eukprot:9626545-Karenia_brevis.AAC.1
MKINRGIFEDIGYTSRCAGCRAIRTDAKNPQNHSEECRRRVEAELAKTPEGKGKIEEAEERMSKRKRGSDEKEKEQDIEEAMQ